MHIKKGGKAIGFGVAAGEDETVTFGWPIKLNAPLEVEQGGTGSATAGAALTKLGAVAKAGDTMTGNLSIRTSLYPSLYLLPTYNNTTNRVVFEGSYAQQSPYARSSYGRLSAEYGQRACAAHRGQWNLQRLSGFPCRDGVSCASGKWRNRGSYREGRIDELGNLLCGFAALQRYGWADLPRSGEMRVRPWRT